jgi:hypothetical protein
MLTPRAADLNEIVEDFVRNCAAAGVGDISAQTGCDPIPVNLSAAALRDLLDTLQDAWRETRGPHDKLELLCWDSGPEARLAIVLTRSSRNEHDSARAPAFIAMHNIFKKLQASPHACGAVIEADFALTEKSDAAAMTILLPKPPVRKRAVAKARNVWASLMTPGVTDRVE